jgi:hypothetical protein
MATSQEPKPSRRRPPLTLWAGVVSLALSGLAVLVVEASRGADFADPGAFVLVYAAFFLPLVGVIWAAAGLALALIEGVFRPRALLGLLVVAAGTTSHLLWWRLFSPFHFWPHP